MRIPTAQYARRGKYDFILAITATAIEIERNNGSMTVGVQVYKNGKLCRNHVADYEYEIAEREILPLEQVLNLTEEFKEDCVVKIVTQFPNLQKYIRGWDEKRLWREFFRDPELLERIHRLRKRCKEWKRLRFAVVSDQSKLHGKARESLLALKRQEAGDKYVELVFP